MIPDSAREQLDAALHQVQALRVLVHRRLTPDVGSSTQELDSLEELISATTDTLRDMVSVLDDLFDIDRSIAVSKDATAVAVSLVTAYLDGLARDDGFELLSASILETLSSGQTSARHVAEILAALARVAANMSLERTGDVDETLLDLQGTARRLGTS